MMPVGGQGANTALLDAVALADAICAGGKDNIGEYESKMREWSTKYIMLAFGGGAKMFDAPSVEECKPYVYK